MSVKAPSPQERSAAARARLLAAANELFYAEGVQSVGIDRVIEHAGVAKATLYSAFGSKDGLVRAYLQARHAATARAHGAASSKLVTTPRRAPGRRLRGAGPVVHRAGLPRLRVRQRERRLLARRRRRNAAEDYRTWLHYAVRRPRPAGRRATDPKSLAQQLVLLYDGAGISAWMDRDPSAETAARTIAAALVDAAIPA